MMIRYLRALGISVVAVFAMSAMVASAAEATSYWFKSDAAAGGKTTLTGEQVGEGTVTTTAGTTKCKKVHYTGSIVGSTVSTVTLHPEYAECTAFGFSATVTTTGCDFVLHVETATAGGQYHATTTLDCTAGNEVTIVAKLAGITKCTLHITPQDMGTVTLTNAVKANGVKDITVDVNVSKMKYTETQGQGAGACAGSAAGKDVEDGSYVGTTTLTGFNEAGAETNIFLE